MKKTAVVLMFMLLLGVVSMAGFVSAHSVDVDGNPGDWKAITDTQDVNTWKLYSDSGEYVWKDNTSDQQTDNDQYLPGSTSSHTDITEFRVTSDDQYLYILVTFRNMSNLGEIGTNGGTFLAIAIDDGTGTETYMAGNSETQINGTWKYQLVVNLAASNYTGSGVTTDIVKPASNWGAIFYIVNDSWSFQNPSGALAAVSIPNNAIEIRIPKSMFSSNSLTFWVMSAAGWSNVDQNQGGTWDYPSGGTDSDAEDVLTTAATTKAEVSDGIISMSQVADISQVPFFSNLAVAFTVVLGAVLIFRRY